MVGKMCNRWSLSQESVLLGSCLIKEASIGEMSVREVSAGDLSFREMSVGEISSWDFILQSFHVC